MDLTLWWRAYGDADVNTDYKILWDGAVSGTFAELATVNATNRGDGSYFPFTTTLAAEIDSETTSITLTDATDFDNGDRAKIDGETILLDGKSGDTFASCIRGADSTIRRPHLAETVVFAMHESYLHENVDFDTRHAIRYRVVTVLGSVELRAAEGVAVSPSKLDRQTSDYVVMWGILDRTTNLPVAGTAVQLQLSGHNFNLRTGETYATEAQATTTDDDGYWELLVPRRVALSGGNLSVVIGGVTLPLVTVPDVDSICYLECI